MKRYAAKALAVLLILCILSGTAPLSLASATTPAETCQQVLPQPSALFEKEALMSRGIFSGHWRSRFRPALDALSLLGHSPSITRSIEERSQRMLEGLEFQTGSHHVLTLDKPFRYLHHRMAQVAHRIYLDPRATPLTEDEVVTLLSPYQTGLGYRQILQQGVFVQLILPNGDLVLSRTPPSFPLSRKDPVIVLDVGGTGFRAGIATPEGQFIVPPKRINTPNFLNRPNVPMADLQRELIDTIVTAIDHLRTENSSLTVQHVSIGFAATLDRQGVVRMSAVHWGAEGVDYPLLAALETRCPTMTLAVTNDQNASVYRYLDQHANERYALMTVSSGFGIKIADGRHPDVILQDEEGTLSGEIGHTVIDPSPDAPLCSCGGRGHLGAFVSGRAAERQARQWAQQEPERFRASRLFHLQPDPTRIENRDLVQAIHDHDAFALDLLNRLTARLAPVMWHVVAAVGVDKFILYGGFAQAVGEPYRQSLLHNLEAIQLPFKSRSELDPWITWGANDDNNVLLGAARMAYQNAAKVLEPAGNSTLHSTEWPKEALREGEIIHHTDLTRILTEIILFTPNVFDPNNPRLKDVLKHQPAVIVLDDALEKRWRPDIEAYVAAHNLRSKIITIPGGEGSKTMEQVLALISIAEEFGLPRLGYFVGVGGGSVLDVTGFAASIYRRWTPYVRIPTTLLGMVDAAVGVKNGINFKGRKNFIGTLQGPEAVLIDTTFLRDLSPRMRRTGLSEIIKAAAVADPDAFALLEAHPDLLFEEPKNKAEQIMFNTLIRKGFFAHLNELELDYYEKNLQRKLDFGHEFGHILESASEGRLHHGEAVALGMALSMQIGFQKGLTDPQFFERFMALLERVGLPIWDPLVEVDALWSKIEYMRQHKGGLLSLVVPITLGEVIYLEELTREELAEAINALKSRGTSNINQPPSFGDPTPSQSSPPNLTHPERSDRTLQRAA